MDSVHTLPNRVLASRSLQNDADSKIITAIAVIPCKELSPHRISLRVVAGVLWLSHLWMHMLSQGESTGEIPLMTTERNLSLDYRRENRMYSLMKVGNVIGSSRRRKSCVKVGIQGQYWTPASSQPLFLSLLLCHYYHSSLLGLTQQA